MAIKIAQRYGKIDRRSRSSEPVRELTQKLSYVILDLICSYLVSENRNIKMKGYKTVKELFSIINPNDYKSDADIERIDFIRFALDARLKYGLMDSKKVMDYIISKDIIHAGIYNINIQEMSNQDVEYVNNMMTSLLDSATFSAYIHKFADISRDFDNASAYEKTAIVNNWKDMISNCNNHIRNNKVINSEQEFVSLRPGIFEEYAKDTYSYVTNTSSKLSTGMVGLNYLLGGGFENTRVYGFFGLQGEGKSLTLLNLALQMKMFNKKYKTKDPTKKPAIVYLTLENTKRETFSRLCSMVTGHRMSEIGNSEQVVQMMRENGLVVNDENPIDLIIKYEPSNSVDTGYLYDFADTLADNNYEVICYIVDYINVIKSIDRFSASEERLRLGSIINEMKTIASDMDIPIITAGQLNREANRKVDEAREKGTLNILSYIDRSNLGESMLILNNLDGAFVIAPSYIARIKEKYLSIKLVKHRFEPYTKPLNYCMGIYHPYDNIDSINLTCDVGLREPLFMLDLSCKNVECEVDESVELPNNDNRKPAIFEEENNEAPQVQNPIVLNSDGTKPIYDVYWRTNPKLINGQINLNAVSPERRMRILMKKAMGNVMNSKINSLNGISRYSDEYTRIYDPTGSKEERLAHDYNIKYGRCGQDMFTESDFNMLYSHFMMMKNGEIPDSDRFEEPTKTYEPEKDYSSNGLFIRVPEIDRDAYLKYLSKINNSSNTAKNKSA